MRSNFQQTSECCTELHFPWLLFLVPYSPKGAAREGVADQMISSILLGSQLLAPTEFQVCRNQETWYFREIRYCAAYHDCGSWYLLSLRLNRPRSYELFLGMPWPPSTAKRHSKCACLSPWPSTTGYLTSLFPINLTWIQTSSFIGGFFVWVVFFFQV